MLLFSPVNLYDAYSCPASPMMPDIPNSAMTSTTPTQTQQPTTTPFKTKLDMKAKVAGEVLAWMRTRFYVGDAGSLPKSLVYDEYIEFCRRNGWQPSSAATCGRLVHKAFPDIVCVRKGGRKTMKYHYQHLCLRGDSDRQHSHLLGNRDAYMRDHYHQHMPSSMLHSDPGGLAWDMRDESEEDDEVLMEDMLREPLSHFPVQAPIGSIEKSYHIANNEWPMAAILPILEFTEQNRPRSSSLPTVLPSAVLQQQQQQFNMLHGGERGGEMGMQMGMDKVEYDGLAVAFDIYYQNLHTALLMRNENRARNAIYNFWLVQLPDLFVVDWHVAVCLDRARLYLLMDKLLLNTGGVESKAAWKEWLSTVACGLPLWVQSEAICTVPQAFMIEQREYLAHFSRVLFEHTQLLSPLQRVPSAHPM